MFINSVRLAFVTSVACTPPRTPPDKFHRIQESIVPKRASALLAAGIFFKNQLMAFEITHSDISTELAVRLR
jgi:hypothetical protein